MKIHWLAAAAVVLAMVVAGCGGGSGSDTSASGAVEGTQAASAEETGSGKSQSKGPKLDFRDSKGTVTMWIAMDGFDSAETVSFPMAEKRGYFQKLKISPLTLSPRLPKLTIPYVVEGTDVIGVAHGPDAVAARAKGAPIVIVGNVLQGATAAFIWTKESGIKGIADLKGKTIAIPGLSFQESFLLNVLTEGGLGPLDVKIVSVGNDLVSPLVKGRVDAIFGGSENVEGIDLKDRGLEPIVTPVTELGIPDYDELVLVARRDVAEANPKLMHDFVKALARGAFAATDQPYEAAEFLEASGESNPETSDSAMQEQVASTVGKLSDSGYVDPARFQHLIDWMAENEMVPAYPVEELLPDSGP
jgi:putative hydroxymethylpyrimidine transport system substrate-binding protein